MVLTLDLLSYIYRDIYMMIETEDDFTSILTGIELMSRLITGRSRISHQYFRVFALELLACD